MKKLMFAIAAVAAGAVFAEEAPAVASANVVGYSNLKLRDEGQCITASFLGIGAGKKFKLSEIKVVGYENNEDMIGNGGTSGDFSFTYTDPFGFTMNDYDMFGDDTVNFRWNDTYDETDGWLGGYWVDAWDNEITKDNDVELDVGQAFWFFSPYAADGETYQLVSSGQVAAQDCNFKLRDEGNGIGNGMSYTVKLSSITVTGYENNEDMIGNGGTSGDFSFTYTDPFGFTMNDYDMFGDDTVNFRWNDTYDETDGWLGGYWVDAWDNEITEDNDVDIEMGKGLWFYSPYAADGETYYFNIPAAKLD